MMHCYFFLAAIYDILLMLRQNPQPELAFRHLPRCLKDTDLLRVFY